MKRIIPVIAIAVTLVAVSWNTPAADPFTEKGLVPAVCIVRDGSMETFREARAVLRDGGARALQAFPPNALFARFPPSLDASAFAALPVDVLYSADELRAGELDPLIESVVRSLFNEREILRSAAPVDFSDFRDIIPGIPEEIKRANRVTTGPRTGSPREITARSFEQNAEFLIGTVLVNVIFPESAGGIEEWTEDELAGAASDIAIGLSEYQQHAHWVELDFIVNVRKDLYVSIEPILGDWGSDPVWISDLMDELGIEDGYYITRVHEYNNRTRIAFDADWVFTSFVVDASSNTCWKGSQGSYVAYTMDLGGPFTVVPYPACRFGTGAGFAHVFDHEMSHVFYALDEYMVADPDMAYWDCNARSGYMAVPNLNTRIRQCQERTECIMDNAAMSLPLAICPYTLGQVGLWDENENSIPDLYEIAPSIAFLDIPGVSIDTVLSNSAVMAVRAWNDAVPNRNPYQDTDERVDYAPWLTKGIFWVNDGFDQKITPSDRAWDESREDIGFIFSGLSPGKNVLHVKVENCVGLSTEASQEIYYIGIRFDKISAIIEEEYIDLSWITAKEVFGSIFDVTREDMTAGTIDTLASIDTPVSTGGGQNQYTYRDGTIVPGHEYRYQIVAKFDVDVQGEHRHFVFPSQSIYKTALLPVAPAEIVSNLLPNPTSGRTSFTVDIPKSYYDPTGGSRAARSGSVLGSPASVETKTHVDIAVFNVLGQRIATIYSRNRYGGLEPYTWDGCDRDGSPVPPGVYFIRIVAGDKNTVRKVVVIR